MTSQIRKSVINNFNQYRDYYIKMALCFSTITEVLPIPIKTVNSDLDGVIFEWNVQQQLFTRALVPNPLNVYESVWL